MTVVCTPYCGQVGISDMFVWGPSMLAVQPIAASAEGPSADSRTTFPKTQNKDEIPWGPLSIRRLWEAVHMSGFEFDSLKVCMLACRAQATTSFTSSIRRVSSQFVFLWHC